VRALDLNDLLIIGLFGYADKQLDFLEKFQAAPAKPPEDIKWANFNKKAFSIHNQIIAHILDMIGYFKGDKFTEGTIEWQKSCVYWYEFDI
jgi:hypothetical protein